MDGFIIFYQNLPLSINPIAFQVGFFSLTWYSIMYFIAFLVIYLLLRWRIKNDPGKSQRFSVFFENIETFFIYSLIGLIVGARLGYVFFYDFHFFLENPLKIISPLNNSGNFVGIYGLSYHGGLIGIILAAIIFAKKYKINFWEMADFIIPAIPAGYFFGRIGNFLNGELYGRITGEPWGMFFLDDRNIIMRRHPSQLYEAFFEGIVLFIIFWFLRNNKKLEGKFLPLYILSYGIVRFFIEFFREPDTQIGFIFGFLTLGQIFCLGMILAAMGILWYNLNNKKINKK